MKIEIGITHEVVINGDKSWIRLAITDDFDCTDYESSSARDKDLDKAIDALSKKVNEKVIAVIEQTVKTVEEYQ